MTPIDSLMILAALLFAKHLLADGPLQTQYQLVNKGVFGHPGGLAHAGLHAGFSFACLLIWYAALAPAGADAAAALWLFGAIVGTEFGVHYLIDYTKCAIDRRFESSSVTIADNGDRRLEIRNTSFFFTLFLADQLAHSLTYVAMIVVVSHGMGLY